MDLKTAQNVTTWKECQVYIDHVMEHIPATKTKLEQIKNLQNRDGTMTQLRAYTDRGWPVQRKAVPELLLPYWPYRADIHVADGILLKGERILIPAPMRREMLERIHHGHQGMTKCFARAQQSMWWPGLSRDIRELVERCEVCCQYSAYHTEPLITTPLPAGPWQRLAADIFQWGKGHYLVVIDYFSRYIEVANLLTLTTATTVERLKVIFARFGIPEVLVTGRSSPHLSS